MKKALLTLALFLLAGFFIGNNFVLAQETVPLEQPYLLCSDENGTRGVCLPELSAIYEQQGGKMRLFLRRV